MQSANPLSIPSWRLSLHFSLCSLRLNGLLGRIAEYSHSTLLTLNGCQAKVFTLDINGSMQQLQLVILAVMHIAVHFAALLTRLWIIMALVTCGLMPCPLLWLTLYSIV